MWKAGFYCGLPVLCLLVVIVQCVEGDDGKKTKDDGKGEKYMAIKNIKKVEDPNQSVEEKSFAATAHLRPTKCQVCRILATELEVELNKTNDIRKTYFMSNRLDGGRDDKQIDYKKSEIRIMDILDVVCQNVYTYRAFYGPEFPYLKGVKSMFRSSLEDTMKKQGLSLKLNAPDEIVEDPTSELRRMFYECNQMIEMYEDEIMHWYMHKQEVDPIDFICAERIVDSDKQDCLRASTEVPENMKQPLMMSEEEKKKIYPQYRSKIEL